VEATYHLKVLTPSAKEIDVVVVSIVAPGEEGYLGVLANHAPLITTLQAGDLMVRFENNMEKTYRISGGILKVARNEAILLTETVEAA
jgi:F-type H+-transporting ATPase subunit epsilon